MSKKSTISQKLICFEKFVDEVCLQIIGCEQFEIYSIDDCVKYADKVLLSIKKSKFFNLVSFCSPTDFEVKRLIIHSLQKYYVMQDFYYNHLPF